MTHYSDGKYGSIKNWTRGRFLERGGMGEVFVGKNDDNGQLFLIKSVSRQPVWSKQLVALQNEDKILRKLSKINCPNILATVGNGVSEMVAEMGGKPTLDLFLKFAIPRGNVTEIVQRHGKLKESVAQAYTFQLLQSLSCMHRNGIVHCDIRSMNVIVCERDVKLVGFGVAKDLSSSRKFSWSRLPEGAPAVSLHPTGNDIALPPEPHNDISALGLVVCEMVTGLRLTIDHSSSMDKVIRSLEEDISLRSMPICKNFIESCLHGRGHWTAERLLSHPWIASVEKFPALSGISSDVEGASTFRDIPPRLLTDTMTPAPSPRLASLKICKDMLCRSCRGSCCRTMDTDTVVPLLSSRSFIEHKPPKKGQKLRRFFTL